MHKQILLCLSLCVVFSCQIPKEKTLPNIVLILADDVGYSDISCFGSEIQTPNIDEIAQNGMRFTQFYNMAKCAPTRSSLMTGLYSPVNNMKHIAQLTKEAGYYNVMSGKEHYDGWIPDSFYAHQVFDSSITFLGGNEYFLPPSGDFTNPYMLNGIDLCVNEIEGDKKPLYQTDFLTDYALNWLGQSKNNNDPVFLYLPYFAPHYPLQARAKDIEKYLPVYKVGWDSLRSRRFDNLKALKVVDENYTLSLPENDGNKIRQPSSKHYQSYEPWASMDSIQQDTLVLEMAVYAAMLDRLDHNVGRVMDYFKEDGSYENTIFIFLSDNGACPFYNNLIEDVLPGSQNSYWSLRTSWANLSNTPFRQYKQTGFEGGARTPFLISWPNYIKANSNSNVVGHVVDVLPTLSEILELPIDRNLHGRSLVKALKGDSMATDPEYLISGLKGFRMFRRENHKIVRMNKGDWELYDLENDPTETQDLSRDSIIIKNRLINEYKEISTTLFSNY